MHIGSCFSRTLNCTVRDSKKAPRLNVSTFGKQLMTEQSHERLIARLQSFSRGVAVVVMLAGILVLVGWTFGLESLRTLVPDTVSMKANTAVCMALLGLALLVGTQAVAPRGRLVA